MKEDNKQMQECDWQMNDARANEGIQGANEGMRISKEGWDE
jgi:hypothetical protein